MSGYLTIIAGSGSQRSTWQSGDVRNSDYEESFNVKTIQLECCNEKNYLFLSKRESGNPYETLEFDGEAPARSLRREYCDKLVQTEETNKPKLKKCQRYLCYILLTMVCLAVGFAYGVCFDFVNQSKNELDETGAEDFSVGQSTYNSRERILLLLGKAENQAILNIVPLNKINNVTIKPFQPLVNFDVNQRPASTAINNILYAVGIGSASNELWKWSVENDEWTKLANLPSSRTGHCVTSIRDMMYVLGGWNNVNRKVYESSLMYDVNSNTWSNVKGVNIEIVNAACVTYNNTIYMFGGIDRDGNKVNTVTIFDTVSRNVSSIPNMADTSESIRAVVWKSKALLFGRYNSYWHDFDLKSWAVREKFKTNLDHFGLTLDGDRVYISGGGIEYKDRFNKVLWNSTDKVRSFSVENFIYDKQANWKHHASLPFSSLVHLYSPLSIIVA